MKKLSLLALVCLYALPVFGQGTQADRIKGAVFLNRAIITITGATPSVATGNLFKTGNGGVTAISNFTGGTDTQEITIVCGDTATSIVHGANIVTASGSDFFCTAPNLSISFFYDAGQAKWIQKGGTGSAGGSPGSPANSLQYNCAGLFCGSVLTYFPATVDNIPTLSNSPSVDFDNILAGGGVDLHFQDNAAGTDFFDLYVDTVTPGITLTLSGPNAHFNLLNGVSLSTGAFSLINRNDTASSIGLGISTKVAGASSIGVGVNSIVSNEQNGIGFVPPLAMYGFQSYVEIAGNANFAAGNIGTVALFHGTSAGASTLNAPNTANFYYSALFDDMGLNGGQGGPLNSAIEQAVIKIKAQTLAGAAGAKYAIKVDSGAGESQWDSAIRFNACLKDSSGSCGTSGQVLSSTVTGISWVAAGSGGAVTSIFGRVGAVVAATNDYSFSQISGTLGHGQLPTLLTGDIPNNAADTTGSATKWAGITGSGTPSAGKIPVATSSSAAAWGTNAPAMTNVTAGIAVGAGIFGLSGNSWDATAALHTAPNTTGLIAALPATCSPGDTYFATDATVGRFNYECPSANTWIQVGWTNQMTTQGDQQPAGAAGIPTRVGGVTSPDGLPYQWSESSSGGVAQVPLWRAPTYPERNIIGTTATDTILSSDCWPKFIDYQGSVAVAVTLPTATTLGVNNCHFKLQNNTSGSATAVTVTPTTWSIFPGTTALVIAQGQTCDIYVSLASATRWDTECHDLPYVAGTNVTITRGQFGPTITATSTAATAWSALTSSTNTIMAAICGTGCSIDVTGTGMINATKLGGITVTGTPSVGMAPVATSSTTATWQTVSGGGGGTFAGLTPGTNVATGFIFAPTATGTVPVKIMAPAGMTANLFEVDLNGVSQFAVTPTGLTFPGTNVQVGSSVSTTAATVGAHGGNTPSLPGCFQVFNNADTLNANICATGTAGRASMQSGIASGDTVQNYILKSPAINTQSGTTYTVVATDFGNLITRTNALAMNDTIARAGAGTTSPTEANFGAGWEADYYVDPASLGSLTLTAVSTSTFSSTGTTALLMPPGSLTHISSSGVNYNSFVTTSIRLSRATIGVGTCVSGTPSTWWNTSLAAVCHTGSNVVEAVLPFADGNTAQIPSALNLPADWVGKIDVRAIFYSPSTSGTVIWNIATACAPIDGSATDDAAFNTADALGTVTLGATANGQWAATKTGITTTGCAAGRPLMLKLTRATDTATGVANLRNLEVTVRHNDLQ